MTLTNYYSATYVVDDYLITASCEGLGERYDGRSREYTGMAVPIGDTNLIKLHMGDAWVIFDMDDATELTGRGR